MQLPQFSNDFLDKCRTETDALADEVIDKLFKHPNGYQLLGEIQSLVYNADLLPPHLPDFIHHYFESTNMIPEWQNVSLLHESALFYKIQKQNIQLSLFALSLPYCYAAGKDATVLLASQRLRNDAQKRLIETGQFVEDVMATNAFEPEGKGIKAIQKVRLIHAVVRYHLTKQGKWEEQNGKPINQESMAGTNLAFSLIILRGLRKLYVSVSDKQEQAYLHRWNIIGSMLGVNEKLLPQKFQESIALEKAIRIRHFAKTQAGVELTQSLLTAGEGFLGAKQVQEFMLPLMKHLLGAEVFSMLGLHTNIPEQSVTRLFKLKTIADGILPLFGKTILPTNSEADISFVKDTPIPMQHPIIIS